MEDQLENVAVGDRVWVKARHGKDRLGTVSRLTPSQIILESSEAAAKYSRFWRGRKRTTYGEPDYGNIRAYSDDYLYRRATPEECEAWDREQEAAKQENAKYLAECERKNAIRDELSELFGASESIGIAHDGREQERDVWQVTFFGLTTEQVRQLATRTGATDAKR